MVMFNHKGTNFGSFNLNSHFTYNDTFTANDGFRLAIGIPYADEDIYDKLKFETGISSWDYIAEPSQPKVMTKLELHNCTDDELDKFYPINDSDKEEFGKKSKMILKCFDHSKLKLAGNWDSAVVSHLFVNVKIKEEHCIT